MLEVITLYRNKDKEYNDIQWKNLVIESFNNFYKQNDYLEEIDKDFDIFWDTIDQDSIHLVIRQNKYVGFFINTYNSINKEISFQLFSHPLSCPMSLRSITKCALIRTFFQLKTNIDSYNVLEFITWHPSLLQVVKQLIPDVSIHMINSNYIIGVKTFSIKDIENIDKVLSVYVEDLAQSNNDFYRIIK